MNKLFAKIHSDLPIFKIDHNQLMIIYTPGYALTLNKLSDSETVNLFSNSSEISNPGLKNTIMTVLQRSCEVVEEWERLKQEPFAMECLTIHAGYECNINCKYCYSKNDLTGNKYLKGFPDPAIVRDVFEEIARNHPQRQKEVTVVYHGSGEPTFHWSHLVDSHTGISAIAQQYNLRIFTYIATNGCLIAPQIDWLAENMNLIGISCDGPPAIQEKQRNGSKSYQPTLENVCERILEKGGRFDIRVTLTKNTFLKQVEIIKYLIKKCKAKNIRIEPVYLAGENSFTETNAEDFLNEFLKAKDYAERHGTYLNYSGVRLTEKHGTYCDVLRNTLRLTPDGLFRNCFCFMKEEAEFVTGSYNNCFQTIDLGSELKQIKIKALKIPNECTDCINVYHCSRGCPDYCVFDEKGKLSPFRCNLHQLYTINAIKKVAESKTKQSIRS